MNDGPIRILMLAAIVLTAALLPTKYVDQKISLENFEVINGDNSSAIRVDSAYIWFPKGFDTANVEFGKGKTSISEMIDNIEQQTGLVHSIGYCGTGMNLLFGGSPIGGIRFSPDNERN